MVADVPRQAAGAIAADIRPRAAVVAGIRPRAMVEEAGASIRPAAMADRTADDKILCRTCRAAPQAALFLFLSNRKVILTGESDRGLR